MLGARGDVGVAGGGWEGVLVRRGGDFLVLHCLDFVDDLGAVAVAVEREEARLRDRDLTLALLPGGIVRRRRTNFVN